MFKNIFSKFFILIVCFICFINLQEIISSGIELEETEQNHIEEEMTIINNEKLSSSIMCFDISDNGYIAVGMSNGCINIYDADGNFHYCYKTDISGIYYLKWQNDGIMVYNRRYKKAYLINNDKIVSFYKITDSAKNRIELDNMLTYKKTYENTVYSLNEDFTVIKSDKIVIVDVTELKKRRNVFIFTSAVLLIVINILALRYKFKHIYDKNKRGKP